MMMGFFSVAILCLQRAVLLYSDISLAEEWRSDEACIEHSDVFSVIRGGGISVGVCF